MYQIDGLINNEYKYIYHTENIQEIDKIAFKMTLNRVQVRIMYDDIVIAFLNGTAHQYKWWKNNFVDKSNILERKIQIYEDSRRQELNRSRKKRR